MSLLEFKKMITGSELIESFKIILFIDVSCLTNKNQTFYIVRKALKFKCECH